MGHAYLVVLWKRSAGEWVQFFPQTLCDLELFTFIVTLPAASRSRQGESLGNNGITVSPMSRIKRTNGHFFGKFP